MASLNKKPTKPLVTTFNGAPASNISPIKRLERVLMSCLLWEDTYYVDGVAISEHLKSLAHKCDPKEVASLAVKARLEGNLRHAPLYLMSILAKRKDLGDYKLADDLAAVINRPDELGEFLAMYWGKTQCIRGDREPLTNQVKKGLAKAFLKFDEYQLDKWNRDKGIVLKDVVRLVRPKPETSEQSDLLDKLHKGTLKTADTWEVALSGGADKKEAFTRLLKEKKLGFMAVLRNLRNMVESRVDEQLVKETILEHRGKSKVLPFRYIAAQRNAPRFEVELDKAMIESLQALPKLEGKTVLLIDVSGSMWDPLSRKSDMNRVQAACGLAALVAGISEDCSTYTFSEKLVEIPPRQGFALMDAIVNSQDHSCTYLGGAVTAVEGLHPRYDRLIVITDEQSHDPVPNPKGVGYMLNVGAYQWGVSDKGWYGIQGFSENSVRYIQVLESEKKTGEISWR